MVGMAFKRTCCHIVQIPNLPVGAVSSSLAWEWDAWRRMNQTLCVLYEKAHLDAMVYYWALDEY